MRAMASKTSVAAASAAVATNCPTGAALVALDAFCHRQFDDPMNSNPISMPKHEFMAKCSEEITRLGGSKALVDGYVDLSPKYRPQ